MTQAYPLLWPLARPRTPDYRRKPGNFNKKAFNGSYMASRGITVAEAMRRLQDEIDRLGATDFVLSANLVRNLDGSPRSNQQQPSDPGVALYFTLDGKPICMPCDTYTRVEQNIAAIAKHIEATRAIERYGVASLNEMFTGFVALPSGKRHWREVFGLHPTVEPDLNYIVRRYRELAAERHPDRGGSDAMMSELNVAKLDALHDLGAQ